MMLVNTILCFICLYAIMAISATLTTGLSNMLTMCQAAFYGIGAYIGVYLLNHFNYSFVVIAILVMVVTGLSSLIVSYASIKLKGDAFILATLGFQMMVYTTIWNWDKVTGGPTGIDAIHRIRFFGTWELGYHHHWILMLAVLVAVIALFGYLKHTPYGRLLRAIRTDNEYVEAMGKNVKVLKIQTFFLSAAFSGLAGLLYASWMRYIDPTILSLNVSILVITAVFLGGKDHWVGALIGSFVVLVLPRFFEVLATSLSSQSVELVTVVSNVGQTLYGLALIIFMFLRPQGLFEERDKQGVSFLQMSQINTQKPFATGEIPTSRKTEEGNLLELKNVCFDYNRNSESDKLLKDVSFDIKKGKVTALIGVNGTGKTTLFNIISGFQKPDKGEILFDGKDITNLSPYKIARSGVARMFQGTQLMADLTLREYLVMAVQNQCQGENPFLAPFMIRRIRRGEKEKTLRAVAVLQEFFGDNPEDMQKYLSKLDEKTSALSYGEQRLVAFISLLMTIDGNRDILLLLDEPTSGVNALHIETMKKLLRQYVSNNRTSVLMIEHKMGFVNDMADDCMYYRVGQLRERTTTENILNDDWVKMNYLGYGENS